MSTKMWQKFRINNTISKILCTTTATTKNHLLIQNRRQSTCEKQLEDKPCDRCKEDVCAYSATKKKKGLFGGLLGKNQPEETVQPSKQQCKIEMAKQQCQPDPDLRKFGGQPYKTCGTAYIIQKHKAASPFVIETQTKEQKIIREIEAEPELKNKQIDPMPAFTTVEQRMMDLNERRLHPLYKKYQVTTRKFYKMKEKQKKFDYKTRSGPIEPKDYPKHLKFNNELLEKKNMYAEYKKVKPPQELVAKILEMQQNERSTLERKFPQFNVELQKAKARRHVYDTLKQPDSITDKFVDK